MPDAPALPAAFLGAPLAHRALHGPGRPENSRAAVRAALAAGCGIEIDVQISADGRAMVFHDATLDRLTAGSGPVAGRTAEALGRIALGGGDEGIPTLPEVLALVAGRAALLIELKDRTERLAGTDGRLEGAVAAALRDYAGPVAVMAFNPDMVARMADLAPGVPRGLTTSAFDPDDWSPLPPGTCDRLRGIPDYGRCGASFVSHEWTDLTRPRIAGLAAQGAAILCWTIRSPAEEAVARRIAGNVTFEGYAARVPT